MAITMRPKITFRERGRISEERHLVWSPAEFAAPSDNKLAGALQEIVQTWRGIYGQKAPSRQDIKATLKALISIADKEAKAAVRAVDGWTEAQLVTAAMRIYRNLHPQAADIPDRVLNPSAWDPKTIRRMAAHALTTLPKSRGGRPSTEQRDIEFGGVLLRYWRTTEPKRPTLSHGGETPFSQFASNMFWAVGRKVGDDRLFEILVAARRVDRRMG